ncbi:hypothetical protein EV360DRAFT_87800 [Lentinula raphanica]|nr:hypothetical protein EV360DRAFT_87800 [Lentinula raphanica]
MHPSKKKSEANLGLGPRPTPAPPPSSMMPGGSRVEKEDNEPVPAPARTTRAMSKSLQATDGSSSSKNNKSASTPSTPTPSKPKRRNPLGSKGFAPKGGNGGAQKHTTTVEDPVPDSLELSPLSSISTMTPNKGKEKETEETVDAGRQRSETISSNDSMNTYPLIHPNNGFITARDEPLFTSCLKYHPVFDHSNPKDDPLIPFGIKNNIILGLNLEQTNELREVLIRWTSPMITEFPFGMYNSLQSYVSSFPDVTFGHSDFKIVEESEDPRRQLWALQYEKLDAVTHMALGLNQVLRSLAKLRDPSVKHYFMFDTKFKFVSIPEGPYELNLLVTALAALKLHAEQSRIRIADLLRLVKFDAGIVGLEDGNESELAGTAFSTISEVREDFGEESAPLELGKLLSRPEYASAIQLSSMTPQVIFETYGNPSRPVPQVIYRPSRYNLPARLSTNIAEETGRSESASTFTMPVSAVAPTQEVVGALKHDVTPTSGAKKHGEFDVNPRVTFKEVSPSSKPMPPSLSAITRNIPLRNLPGRGITRELPSTLKSILPLNEGLTLSEWNQISSHRPADLKITSEYNETLSNWTRNVLSLAPTVQPALTARTQGAIDMTLEGGLYLPTPGIIDFSKIPGQSPSGNGPPGSEGSGGSGGRHGPGGQGGSGGAGVPSNPGGPGGPGIPHDPGDPNGPGGPGSPGTWGNQSSVF